MRRIKRRIPGATPDSCVSRDGESASAPGGDGYRAVTTLDGAVQAIAAALAEDAAAGHNPSAGTRGAVSRDRRGDQARSRTGELG